MNHSPDAGKMVCPYCGAEASWIHVYANCTKYQCATYVFCNGTVSRSDACRRKEMDKLQARVKELEAKLAAITPIAATDDFMLSLAEKVGDVRNDIRMDIERSEWRTEFKATKP